MRQAKANDPHGRLWQVLVGMVMDTRDDWRRKVSATTGLPFTRIRALKRLANGPLTLSQLAYAMSSDAPAATVAVNDLEARGLVERGPHPEDRRAKIVSITAAGKKVLASARSIDDEPPAPVLGLSVEETERMLHALERKRP